MPLLAVDKGGKDEAEGLEDLGVSIRLGDLRVFVAEELGNHLRVALLA